MVLNDDGVPCLKVGVFEKIGTEKVQVGTELKKWGRGHKKIPIVEERPIEKQVIKLVPATEHGWKKEIVFEKPQYNNRAGRIELFRIRFRADAFRCSGCKTNRYILVRQIGHSYERYPTLPHHGGGVFRRCFRCDNTNGPLDEGEYGEVTKIKDSISRREALQVIRKYGLDITVPK